MDVAHFVKQNKECIADDEFHPIDALLFGEVLEARIVLERARKFVDPFLEWLWSRLPRGRSAADQQHRADRQMTKRSHCKPSEIRRIKLQLILFHGPVHE